jgi:DNA-binding response OmpR family regulator
VRRAGTVLVVDDDKGLLSLLRISLRFTGLDVAAFDEPDSALDWLSRNNAPSAVVLDLRMPSMDGREFYRRLRTLGVTSPVVIASAYGAEYARTELGAEAAISKPFNPDDLIATVNRLLPASQDSTQD